MKDSLPNCLMAVILCSLPILSSCDVNKNKFAESEQHSPKLQHQSDSNVSGKEPQETSHDTREIKNNKNHLSKSTIGSTVAQKLKKEASASKLLNQNEDKARDTVTSTDTALNMASPSTDTQDYQLASFAQFQYLDFLPKFGLLSNLDRYHNKSGELSLSRGGLQKDALINTLSHTQQFADGTSQDLSPHPLDVDFTAASLYETSPEETWRFLYTDFVVKDFSASKPGTEIVLIEVSLDKDSFAGLRFGSHAKLGYIDQHNI